jgi:hypothetical protein
VHFFDQYSQFYESGITPNANRLRCRFDAIIQANRDVLNGARVLDVASHNGRWSAATVLAGGAAHVTGVEPRAELVDVATRVAAEIGIADRVEFRVGTILGYLQSERPADNAFDVVMCNGYFYHTYDHFQLMKDFCSVGRTLILDTEISPRPAMAIFYAPEPSNNIGNAVHEAGEPSALVGRPTRSLLIEMLKVAGYKTWAFFKWSEYNFESTEWMKNYIEGRRVTVRAMR